MDIENHFFVDAKKYKNIEANFTKTRNLLKNLPGFLYQYQLFENGTSFFPFLSSGVEEVYGYSLDEISKKPSIMWDIIHPEDFLKVTETTIKSSETMCLWFQRFRIINPTKGIRWVEGRATPQQMPDGSVLWSGYINDDTELQKSKEEAELATYVYNNSQEGIIIADKNWRVKTINPAFLDMTGFEKNEVANKRFNLFCKEFISKAFLLKLKKEIILNGKWHGEVSFKKKDKTTFEMLLSIDSVKIKDTNQISHYVVVVTDISPIKEHQKKLELLANYDPLTNLPNRRLLSEKLENSLEHSNKINQKLALCFIDLDNFKPINDKYGHDVGDEFLRKLAKSFLDSVRPHDTVSRIGGDEFIIILNNIDTSTQLQSMLERFSDICSAPYKIGNLTVQASASIGVVVYPTVKGSADELLRFADQSMYKAKQQGRKRYVFFDQEQENESLNRYLQVENFKNALKNGEICLWFQPKFDLPNNQISGVEALVRWKTKDKIIPAQDFVNIMIGNGLDQELGHFVLENALKTQELWKKHNIKLPISINISPEHILNDHFKEELHNLLEKYNTDPDQVIIEILETTKISDFEIVIQRLKSCKELGVSFSLDDFGTGYSSLGYLRTLPVDEVKIDKSFILSMLTKKEDQMIVKGIIELSHALGRTVVAEGVETKEHIKILHEMGIDIVQGYEIAKPMDSDSLIDWIKEQSLV